jgi:hypothetical protein
MVDWQKSVFADQPDLREGYKITNQQGHTWHAKQVVLHVLKQ